MNKQYIKDRFDRNHQIITKSKSQNDSLFAGRLGLAYYHALLHQVSDDEETENRDLSIELLEEVLESFYSSKSTLIQATYTAGAAGLGYTICYLNKILSLDIDIEDELSDLDEYLFNSAVNLIEQDNLDCLHGSGGILFYFTERGNIEYLNKLIPIIISKGIQNDNGIWFQNTFMETSKANQANLSISHGMAGLLILLIKAAPYLNEENIDILQKAVKESIRFINSYYLPIDLEDKRDSFYPQIVNLENNRFSHKGRLAWCYGDLGIILLFYKAGKLLNDSELINKADAMGIQTLTRQDQEETGINEPFFCHGAAGLSSFYYRLYLESGNKKYMEGMDFWMKETADFFSKDNTSFTDTPHEILDGLIGVNIAILEYLNKNKNNSLSNIFFL